MPQPNEDIQVRIQGGLMNGVPKVELSLLDTGDRLQLDPDGAREMARHLCDAADRVEQLALNPSLGVPRSPMR